MNEMMQDGAVCGLDGCSTSVTAATPQTNPSPQPGATRNLTIVSDVICPWCFVAKRNLDSALRLAGSNLKIEVTWKPFEINPDMPKEGMNRRAYRSRKFGSWEHSQALDAQVATAAAQAGIEFRHDLMERTPNTFNAHRLIWLARPLSGAAAAGGRPCGDRPRCGARRRHPNRRFVCAPITGAARLFGSWRGSRHSCRRAAQAGHCAGFRASLHRRQCDRNAQSPGSGGGRRA